MTNCLSDKKTHSAIPSEKVKLLSHDTKKAHKKYLVRPKIEHIAPLIVGLFNLQDVLLRTFEFLRPFFWKNFMTPTSMKSVKWTPSLFPALLEDTLRGSFLPRNDSSAPRCAPGLHRYFHCSRNGQLFSPKVPQHTQKRQQDGSSALQRRVQQFRIAVYFPA